MTFRLPVRARAKVLAWAVVCAISALIVLAAKERAEHSGIVQLLDQGEGRLGIYNQGLKGELGRYDYLPTVIALNADVVAVLQNPKDDKLRIAVNDYLQRVNASANSSAVYILDRNGVTLAASNWDEDVSFVGVNLDYRPYFQEALKAAHGRFVGIGTTSGIPGYFRSSPIFHDGAVLGVLALKVSLEKLEAAWRAGDASSHEIVAVADRNGVIFLSSRSSWKYETLGPLGPEVMEQIRESHQYEGASLKPIGVLGLRPFEAARVVRLNCELSDRQLGSCSDEFLEQARPVDATDWRLFLFSNLQPVKRSALNVATASSFAIAALILLSLYLHQRRQTLAEAALASRALQSAHDRLERDVAERTADLVQANEQLLQEIVERNRAEAVLREAQAGLVHAEKMAALGQMSAGLRHELNQPLTALRTLSDNARVLLERNRLPEAKANLFKISDLSERMGNIVAHWKQLSRKSRQNITFISVRKMISNSMIIVDAQLKLKNIHYTIDFTADDAFLHCDPIRFEQVLINLFSNAIDAVRGASRPEIHVRVSRIENRVLICVRDNGAGIPEDVIPRLFEPFFTTKETGDGLGLGLAISADIIRELNGTISAHNPPGGGAEFIIDLPVAPPEAHHA
jgi:two-component system C4-dicarboxylate transport sensor histidine kinase DctB